MRPRFVSMMPLLVCAFVLNLAESQVHAQRPAAKRRPTAALISPDENVITSLFETKLLAGDQAKWLERNEIKRLLEEQKLDAAFGAAGGKDRLSLGKLLKADLLVLVRTVSSPENNDQKLLECVVCETKQGLRLRVTQVPVGKDAEEAVRSLAAAFDAALQKYSQSIREIVAVSPLVSDDLSFKYNYLQSAYARLIEQTLLEQPGIVVVELGEAQAISKELALSSGGQRVVRRNRPLFIFGKYKRTGNDESGTISLRLRLLRGETELAALDRKALKSEKVSSWLTTSTDELLREVKFEPTVRAEPEEEAKLLAERAHEFMRIGNYEEALGLLEASVLLKPNDEAVRYQAVVAMTRLLPRYWVYAPESTDEQAQRYFAFYLRGLEHLEAFSQVVGPLQKYEQLGMASFIDDFGGRARGFAFHPKMRPEIVAMGADAGRQFSAAYMRIERARTKAGYGDEFWWMRAMQALPEKERIALTHQLIEECGDRPDGQTRAVLIGMKLGVDPRSPEHAAFLKHLSESKSAVARAAAVNIPQQLEANERLMRELLEKGARPKPIGDPVNAIRLARVDLDPESNGVDPPMVMGCMPVGPGVDALWTDKILYLMKQKGELTELRRSTYSSTPPVFNGFSTAPVFDGKYIWIVSGYSELLAIHPQTQKVVEFTASDGLPLDPAAARLARTGQPHSVRIVPLAPGRLAIAGYMGRTWLAFASLDGAKKSVRIVHEAKEASDADDKSRSSKTTVTFVPGYMATLPGEIGGKKPQPKLVISRTLLDRATDNRPLVVDINTEAVSVADSQMFTYEDPSITLVDGCLILPQFFPGNAAPHLYRFRPPNMEATSIYVDPPDGLYLQEGNRIHILGKKWYIFDTSSTTLHFALNPVPWFYNDRWVRGGIVTSIEKARAEDYKLLGVHASNHYGILVRTKWHNEENPRMSKFQLWQATLDGPEKLLPVQRK